jgi:hypothetical protein
MLAVSERVRGDGGATVGLIWHKPVGRVVAEYQAIACSADEGIVMPGPKRDVSVRHSAPGEVWCAECLQVVRESGKASSRGGMETAGPRRLTTSLAAGRRQ